MKLLSVASEAYPLVKTGGLADVVGALPGALSAEGVKARTLLPGYPAVCKALGRGAVVWQESGFFGGEMRLLEGSAGGLDLFVIDAPHLYGRPGNPYMAPDGGDWADNALRFGALAWTAARIGQGAVKGYLPDVLHAHDWQAGLAPAYLHYAGGARPATVLTIHNLAFQGQVPSTLLEALRLPPEAYTPAGVEYYHAIGMLKAGLVFADRITTVSPGYAAEICTPGRGMGMDGVFAERAAVISGILNGIDTAVWDPATDPALAAPFTAKTPRPRWKNKAALQKAFELRKTQEAPLFGVVSRLTDQKGLDLIVECLDLLRGAGAQLAVLGSGEAPLQAAFAAAAAAHPGEVGVRFGYDEALAHLMQGGSDVILVPSRFEPCGLTQLCALRYGALPLVSHTGGLGDTVIDANPAALAAKVATGWQFAPATAHALGQALRRALAVWQDQEAWRAMQRRAMASDVSWAAPARAYAALYRDALAARG